VYDYHLHSNNSADGKRSIDEVCSIMIERGFKEIAFTDHLDYDCPAQNDHLLDYDRYSADIEEARQKYGRLIHIIKGMEIGLQPQVVEKNVEYTLKNKFDFVIGSVHHVDNLELFTGDFCQGKIREEAYPYYLEEVCRMVESFHNFHVLGHLDVVRRYKGFENRTMTVEEFPDLIDAILKNLIETGRGIEVNSSGYRHGLNDTLPSLNIVKRFRELGGEIVTVGSDAHRGDAFGYKITESFRVLKEAGFAHVCLFREGNPIMVDIP
jgi:histidinol-phosphatase (PHP family)